MSGCDNGLDLSLLWCAEMKNGQVKPRVGHTGTIIKNQFWVFGGYFRYGNCIEGLQYLDLDTLEWGMAVVPFGPEARAWHSAVLISSCKWLIFGGFNGSSYLNDLHVLTVKDTRGTVVWDKQLKVKGQRPVCKQNASMTIVRGTIYVFGGYSQGKCVAHLHTIDTRQYESDGVLEWAQLNIDLQHSPSRRCGHSAWVAADRYIYIFGGYDNEMHCLDTVSEKWLAVETLEPRPASRRLAGSASIFNPKAKTTLLLLTGGLCDHTNTTYGDSWVFDCTSHRWTELENLGQHVPRGLASHTLVLHHPLGRMLCANGEESPDDCLLILAFSGELPNNEKHSSMFILALQAKDDTPPEHSNPRLTTIASQYQAASRVATVGPKPCRACTMCSVS